MSDWCIHKNCTEMLPCILSLLRPPAGQELWGTGTRGSACPCHLLGTHDWTRQVSFTLCPGSFWVPSAKFQLSSRWGKRLGSHEMLLITAINAILKHSTIKMCNFTVATCNLPDIAGYGQYLCLNLEAEERQVGLIIFYLLILFLSQFPQTHEISCFSTCNPSFGVDTNKELCLCWLRGEWDTDWILRQLGQIQRLYLQNMKYSEPGSPWLSVFCWHISGWKAESWTRALHSQEAPTEEDSHVNSCELKLLSSRLLPHLPRNG